MGKIVGSFPAPSAAYVECRTLCSPYESVHLVFHFNVGFLVVGSKPKFLALLAKRAKIMNGLDRSKLLLYLKTCSELFSESLIKCNDES